MPGSSQASSGFGSTISIATYQISNGSIGTYAKVIQTIDLDSPAPEPGDIKVTNNDSPTGGNPNGCQEYMPGMTEPGELEFEAVYWKAAHQTQLMNKVGDGNIYAWKETFNDAAATICTFTGYLKQASITGKTENDALKGKVKIKLTGPVVWS